ncbi:MAG: carbon storage regulator CsrA [Opitutales bacterium]|nr:carbon storage regulator CsrA [Opitutales bacterium]NRA28165.1 carbon storage regulator CsrA [Opitutales bacterium]
MLILTRKTDEAIVIGSDVEIIVTKVEGDSVKLGIKAPREVTIYRKEVLDQIRQSNLEAAVGPQKPVTQQKPRGGKKKNSKISKSAKNLLKKLG